MCLVLCFVTDEVSDTDLDAAEQHYVTYRWACVEVTN
jgi:hypothetical protein